MGVIREAGAQIKLVVLREEDKIDSLRGSIEINPGRERSYREVEERSGGTMQRAASTEDISQNECSEDRAIRLHTASNLILLIGSFKEIEIIHTI